MCFRPISRHIKPVHNPFKYKNLFEKGYKGFWSKEIFIVSKVKFTNPITYLLKDQNDEEIQGSFYSSELQKTLF